MKIVVAMDSFKRSLSAIEASKAVAAGIERAYPRAEIEICPLADGGEGTVDVVVAARGGSWLETEVMGPLPNRRVMARFGELPGRHMVLEMARASGLELLAPQELDPLSTTTYGTGELLRAALDRDPQKLWLAVGGSATVDGGVGAAMALGWKFLDGRGREIGLGGSEIGKIRSIEPPEPRLAVPPLEVLCDVDNPLCGPRGAARAFAPQKGADTAAVERLESHLENLADVVERELGVKLRDIPGGGAAGGLAAGAVAFLQARLVSGIDAVIEMTGLARQIEDADWIVTGEGRLDRQSLDGKVLSGVLRLASVTGCRVAAVVGSVDLDRQDLEAAGLKDVEVSKPDRSGLDESMKQAESLLALAAERLALRRF
ncbi:MAG: glycerate kinase [Acidobacteriota bacterium]